MNNKILQGVYQIIDSLTYEEQQELIKAVYENLPEENMQSTLNTFSEIAYKRLVEDMFVEDDIVNAEAIRMYYMNEQIKAEKELQHNYEALGNQ